MIRRALFASLLLCLHLLPTGVFAGEERHVDEARGSSISSASLSVSDRWVNYMNANVNWADDFSVPVNQFVVTLKHDETSMAYAGSDWSLEVEYTITLTELDGTTTTHTGKTIAIDHDYLGVAYATDISYEIYAGDYVSATVDVTGITPSSFAYYEDDIVLELALEQERYFYFDATAPTATASIPTGLPFMDIAWSFQQGSESYDVEWLFVDTGEEPTNSSDVTYNWSSATRVNVTGNSYRASLAYPKGVMLYRVRGVGVYQEDDNFSKLKHGAWSYDPQATDLSQADSDQKSIAYAGLDTDMNWQYTIGFSEEGKHMEAISYFDGSLRNRQSVTVINSDNTAVVGETVYDHQGRPAVQIMPVPVESQGMGYYLNYNNDAFNGGFDRTYFDSNTKLNPTGTGPTTLPSGSEASRYYGSGSTLSSPYMDYVPNANGYAFTQTRFKPDATGRPMITTSPGDGFELGDHNTTYHYGSPLQTELDRLFGNEAGFASRYERNLTIDPNGQVSVTYKDQSGRVVATALAGDGPSNLMDIDLRPTPSTISESNVLEQENSPSISGDEYVFTKTITIPSQTACTLNYSISAMQYEVSCLNPSAHETVDCKYDYMINITDEENNSVYTTGTTSNPWISSVNSVANLQIIENLTIGTYTITKRMRLNAGKRQEYVDNVGSYLLANPTNNCLPYPDDTPNIDDCDYNCESQCVSSYQDVDLNGNDIYYDAAEPANEYWNDNGTWKINGADYTGSYTNDLPTAVNDAIEACKDICITQSLPSDPCEVRLNAMLQDMSPGGQYLDNSIHEYLRDPATGAWLLDENNLLQPNTNYKDDWLNANTSLSSVSTMLSISPTLSNWDALRDNWDDNYAMILVENLHPEWCAYEFFCEEAVLPKCHATTAQNMAAVNEYGLLMQSGRSDSYANQNADASGPDHSFMFLNPLNLTYGVTDLGATTNNTDYVSQTGVSNTDPLFCQLGSELTAALKNFYTFEYNSNTYNYSLWYVLDDPDNIADAHGADITASISDFPQDVIDFFNILHGDGTNDGLIDATPAAGQIYPYEFFRGVYLFYREYYLYDLFDNDYDCPASSSEYAYWDGDTDYNAVHESGWYELRFPRNILFENLDLNSVTSFASDFQDDVCNSNCEAAAAQWMEQLAECTASLSDTELEQLKDDLVQICIYGCEESNDWTGSANGDGSSTVYTTNSGNPGYASTFAQVLDDWIPSCTETIEHPVLLTPQDECSCGELEDFIAGLTSPTVADPSDPTPTELVHITSQLNALQSGTYSYDTATVHSWINFCNNPVGVLDNSYPQELECIDCKCTQLVDFADQHGLVADWSNVQSSEYTAIADELEEQFGTDWSSVVQTWVDQCLGNSTADPMDFGTFPEDLRCLPDQTADFDPFDMDDYWESECEDEATILAEMEAQYLYQDLLTEYLDAYRNGYTSTCLSDIDTREQLSIEYELDEYYYTLYYYDQAGNLAKTVPPQGVDVIDNSSTLNLIKIHRNNNKVLPYGTQPTLLHPDHKMITNYRYNSYGQVIEQTTPDGGTTHFWHDTKGRVVASQNAKQAALSPQAYSYTVYGDHTGATGGDNWRILEVGELHTSTAMTDDIAQWETGDPGTSYTAWLDTWDDGGGNKRIQVTQTHYDAALNTTVNGYFNGLTDSDGQELLRNRVATITYEETYDADDDTYESAMHYSYDIHGNVNVLVNENTELAHLEQDIKYMQYEYDLVSGNVNEVHYQAGMPDQFYHRYFYDADNRITEVHTSQNGQTWDRDAKYFYYPHGPLARTELGDKHVQATDHAYTLQGWLKAGNASTISATRDMGGDGNNVSTNKNGHFGRDAAAFSLHYYEGDYSATSTGFLASSDNTTMDAAAPGLYNGNISRMVTALLDNSESLLDVHGNAYQYDQLNRLKEATVWKGTGVQDENDFSTATNNNDYTVGLEYDLNGNITSLDRNAHAGGTAMDELTYHYPSNGQSNRLEYVDDAITAVAYGDIGDQASGNYGYDAIGQLTSDYAEAISTIDWNVYNKVTAVNRTQGQQVNSSYPYDLEFAYGPDQTRLAKTAIPRNSSGREDQESWTTTYYVRDASGNVMAVYNRSFETLNGNKRKEVVKLQEQHVYGSKRLGMANQDLTLAWREFSINGHNSDGTFIINNPEIDSDFATAVTETTGNRELGAKVFELSNHLGNVLATVSDHKLAIEDGSTGTVDYYTADVSSYSDYYPFGMQMTNRSGSTASYRHGFNGMEKDDEMYGTAGSSYDFGARLYDTRLGRWNSIDPLASNYPFASPFSFVAGNPIQFIDPDGRKIVDSNNKRVRIKFTKDGIVFKGPGKLSSETEATIRRLGATEIGKNAVRRASRQLHKQYKIQVVPDQVALYKATTAQKYLADDPDKYPSLKGKTFGRKDYFLARGLNAKTSGPVLVYTESIKLSMVLEEDPVPAAELPTKGDVSFIDVAGGFGADKKLKGTVNVLAPPDEAVDPDLRYSSVEQGQAAILLEELTEAINGSRQTERESRAKQKEFIQQDNENQNK